MPNEKSTEIYNAFSKYVKSRDKTLIEKFSLDDLEFTLLQYWQDKGWPAYMAIEQRIQKLKEKVKLGKENEGLEMSSNGLVFIACGQLEHKEIVLGEKVEKFLGTKSINFYRAESVNDLADLNAHIFKNLTDCIGFMAIFHKRLKIASEESDTFTTSVWINQEIAIQAYLRFKGKTIPSLVLYENDSEIDGLIKYTIAKPQRFGSDEEALSKIEEWVKSHDFKNYKEKGTVLF